MVSPGVPGNVDEVVGQEDVANELLRGSRQRSLASSAEIATLEASASGSTSESSYSYCLLAETELGPDWARGYEHPEPDRESSAPSPP